MKQTQPLQTVTARRGRLVMVLFRPCRFDQCTSGPPGVEIRNFLCLLPAALRDLANGRIRQRLAS